MRDLIPAFALVAFVLLDAIIRAAIDSYRTRKARVALALSNAGEKR